MNHHDIHDHEGHARQLEFQRKNAWNIDTDIEWSLGVDPDKFLLPLDEMNIAFPGANAKQQLAISQLMGLVVNAAIAELETVAAKIRGIAWRAVLDSYPVNPEMYALGEQFFQEEAKHAQMFHRYHNLFCQRLGVQVNDLDIIIPKAYGAVFQRAILANARAGGHAFWWAVALVEEVSLVIYQQIYSVRNSLDPLFFQIHRRHFEEESKHTNYAFLMLELIKSRNQSIKQKLHLKLDLLFSEFFCSSWVLAELSKVWRVRELKEKNEFFATLNTCLPLLAAMPKAQLIKHLFVSAPYISLILNHKNHKLSMRSALKHKAWSFRYPKPASMKLKVGEGAESPELQDVWKAS